MIQAISAFIICMAFIVFIELAKYALGPKKYYMTLYADEKKNKIYLYRFSTEHDAVEEIQHYLKSLGSREVNIIDATVSIPEDDKKPIEMKIHRGEVIKDE